MNLAEAMAEWEQMRAELESKLRHANDLGSWPEREMAVRRRLDAIAAALNILREPHGPLYRRAVDKLVREHQEMREQLVAIASETTDRSAAVLLVLQSVGKIQ